MSQRQSNFNSQGNTIGNSKIYVRIKEKWKGEVLQIKYELGPKKIEWLLS